MIVARRILRTDLQKDKILNILDKDDYFKISLNGNVVCLSASKHSFFEPKIDLQFKRQANVTIIVTVIKTTAYELYLWTFVNLFNLTLIIGNFLHFQIIPGFHDFDINVWVHLGFLVVFNLLGLVGSWKQRKEILAVLQALVHTNAGFLESSEMFWSFQEFNLGKKQKS
jgi:hypothetical protein